MNSSNEEKNNLGPAALKVAAYIVLLNAAVAGCAGSPDTNQEVNAPFSAIYEEIVVTGPVPDLRRVRIKKKVQQAAGVSPASVPALTCTADGSNSVALVCHGDSAW